MSLIALAPAPEEMVQQAARTPSFRESLAFCSNMHLAPVFGYPSTEHAYVAAKTLDRSLRARIRREPSPHRAKQMGNPKRKECIIHSVRPDWNEVKLQVMETLLREKFTRHPELTRLLLRTGTLELVERNSWHDTFWGVCNGRGENHLGRLLMKIRTELASLA